MAQYFTEVGAGKRYDQYRPKTHQAVVQKMQQHIKGRRFERVVDVACGTGDSTVPLLAFGHNVMGIDSSDEMLAIAHKRGLSVRKADYSDLPQQGRFDLISTCMAFHWFDGARAIASYKAASSPGAVWLIYDFAFAGHTTSEQFNHWLRNEYFKRYPSPPRNRFDDMKLADDEELSVIASDCGWLPVEFTLEPLIGYLSTQSNIEEATRTGKKLDAIAAELRQELSGIDITGAFKYAYSYEILEYMGNQ
ncbi:class I SAM-dependent methyltransferase [Halomonas sp. AOP43-D1-4]|uniref:class I SAM-dependent methyltransferase n=1 Tax=Halomonas sp. AOP43-D1-4 TaxID=3457658 RepID=UPI0040340721